MGYDVHKLVEGRDLIIGGVTIPHHLGLLGHSDADVLLHAIMDALLGAAALGDIGKHFPDTDPAYKGISSMKLLAHVGGLLEKECYVIENIDATVIAQKPKLRPYIDEMEKMWQRCRIWRKTRSISRQRPKKGSDLPEPNREFPHRRSARCLPSMRAVSRSEVRRVAARAVAAADSGK